MFADFGRFQQFGRVVGHFALDDEKVVERAQSAEYAALRACSDAYVVQGSDEVLQVVERHLSEINLFSLQIVQQFLQIEHVGIQRMCRIAALQAQILLVCLDDIPSRFLAAFHENAYFCQQIYKKNLR